jgi:hypothetical protein
MASASNRRPRPVKAPTPARRATATPAVDAGEVDAEVLEFIAALDRYKQQHRRPFPGWSEVLLVLKQLGYRKA